MSAYDERLPCGTDLEALLIQVAEDQAPSDLAHQTSCPYCQATLRRIRQRWADVRALSQQPVAVPPGLTARIMDRVRVLAGHVADSILLGHRGGETRITHDTIARVSARLTAAVPGVVFASAKPLPEDPPHPIRLGVAIRLVIAFGPRITDIAETTRARVPRRVRTLTGAEITHIDITVNDIIHPPD